MILLVVDQQDDLFPSRLLIALHNSASSSARCSLITGSAWRVPSTEPSLSHRAAGCSKKTKARNIVKSRGLTPMWEYLDAWHLCKPLAGMQRRNRSRGFRVSRSPSLRADN